jgi:hypothetical protein
MMGDSAAARVWSLPEIRRGRHAGRGAFDAVLPDVCWEMRSAMLDGVCTLTNRSLHRVWIAAMLAGAGVVIGVGAGGCSPGGGRPGEPSGRLVVVDDLTGVPVPGARVIITEADPRHPLKVWDYLRRPRDGRMVVPTNSAGEAEIPPFEGVSGGQQVLVVVSGWVPRMVEWASVRESAWRREPLRVAMRRVDGGTSGSGR